MRNCRFDKKQLSHCCHTDFYIIYSFIAFIRGVNPGDTCYFQPKRARKWFYRKRILQIQSQLQKIKVHYSLKESLIKMYSCPSAYVWLLFVPWRQRNKERVCCIITSCMLEPNTNQKNRKCKFYIVVKTKIYGRKQSINGISCPPITCLL